MFSLLHGQGIYSHIWSVWRSWREIAIATKAIRGWLQNTDGSWEMPNPLATFVHLVISNALHNQYQKSEHSCEIRIGMYASNFSIIDSSGIWDSPKDLETMLQFYYVMFRLCSFNKYTFTPSELSHGYIEKSFNVNWFGDPSTLIVRYFIPDCHSESHLERIIVTAEPG